MRIKKILLTILLLLSTIGLPATAMAYMLTERAELGFDDTLYVKDQDVYAFPEKILVAQIAGAPLEISSDPESWLNMLYYHFITRLEFADIPYNYILDREGQIYEGRTGWEGVIPELKEKEGAILIGYLSESNDLTIQAKEALEDLIEDLSHTYGLPQESVVPVDLYLTQKEDNELGKLAYSESNTTFSRNLKQFTKNLDFSSRQHLDIVAEVFDVDFPESSSASDTFEVSFKIKNSGEVPLFTFNDYLYLVTADLSDSPYAVNGEWDSFDAPTHIEGETIFPGEDIEVVFKMKAPLFPGEYSEEFGIKRLTDRSVIQDTKFSVDFTVEKGDMKLVKILSTGTGTLNVRETPSAGGNLLGEVAEGEILIMVEKGTGWYKVQYDGEKEGWVFGQYVEEVE